MSKGVWAAIVIGLASSPSGGASAADATIGSWRVSIEKDPFSTKRKTVASLFDIKRQGALAVRCFPDGGLSTVLIIGTAGKQFDPGTKVQFKYRADEGQIAEETGEAFGERLIDLPIAREIVKDAATAKTFYFRVQAADDTLLDLAFSPRLSTRALAQINTDCPTPAEDKPSEGDKDKSDKGKRTEGAGQTAVAKALGVDAVPDVSGGTGRTWRPE